MWTTLEEISNYGDCYNVSVTDIADNEWILELEDLEKDTASIIQKLSKKERNIKGVRHKFKKGDVLYSKLRTYLNKVLVAPKAGYCTTEIIPFNSYCDISTHYLCHVLRSAYFLDYTQQCGYGVKMPRLSTNDACKGMVPLPPLSEQQRIVMEIDKWLALIDQIEQGKADLQNTIKQTKSKILDLAIHGKLVPQDPNDEPASVLLERIRAEKEELIKQGKIKRDKKESVIFKGEDNSYYGIHLPDGWDWASLREIALSISDGSHNPPPDNGSGIPLLSAANINDNSILMNEISRWITNEEWKIENQRTNIEVGDVLLTIVGSIGRSAVVQNSNHFALQRSVAVIKPCLINPLYLMHIVQSPQIQKWLTDNSKGTAQKGIYLNALSLMIIPIPPLAEQARIVEKIHIAYKQLDLISNALL